MEVIQSVKSGGASRHREAAKRLAVAIQLLVVVLRGRVKSWIAALRSQ